MKLLELKWFVGSVVTLAVGLTIGLAIWRGEQIAPHVPVPAGPVAPKTCYGSELYAVTAAQPYLVQCKAGKWQIAIPTFEQVDSPNPDRNGNIGSGTK